MTARQQFAYPADLAESVRKNLRQMRRRSPPLHLLRQLFETAFFASMRTEEAEPIRCSLTYISDKNPDPRPPERIVADRWSVSRFAQPIPLTITNLVKVAKSFDSAASSLACFAGGGGLMLWGAIDQRHKRVSYVSRETDCGPERPGYFELTIVGVGTLEVHKDYELVGALRQGRLAGTFSNVLFESGPVRAALQRAIDEHVRIVKKAVGRELLTDRDHWHESVVGDWIASIARVLLGIQQYGHGGAVLLTPNGSNRGLRIKYPLEYRRLQSAVLRHAIHTIRRVAADDQIEELLDARQDQVPALLHLDEAVETNLAEETSSELTGAVRFIAALSRVDGAVVMQHNLSVRGYGTILQAAKRLPPVWTTRDPSAATGVTSADPTQFGTRHQSMMHACFGRPGRVGFVVSQDGDVRAMTRLGDRLLVWEDVRLRRA